MTTIKKQSPRLFFRRPLSACGTLVLFFWGIFFSSTLIAESFSSGLFTQDVIPEVLEEETCSFSTPEVTYPYTQLHASLFQRETKTTLPPITQTWHISCSQPIDGMRLWVNDMAASSVTDGDPTHFSLGQVNDQGSLGYYTVTLANAQVDGQSVLLYHSADDSVVGQPQSAVTLQSSQFYRWITPTGTPASGQQFTVTLTVSPTLNSLTGTQGPLVDGAELNGDLALSVSFGL
ncbi:hypothetical protein [Providencia manganoxydans]|uniref:hypothetical protein n=1 Tax=Providencia manganoxydans TaxID=2923283 RepID=UPI0032DB698F